MSKLSGDFDKDIRTILDGLNDRGFSSVAVSITMKAGGKKYNRNFMDVIIPLILSSIELGMVDDSLTMETLKSDEFRNGISTMITAVVMRELLEVIERDELLTILRNLEVGNGKVN